MHLLTRLLPVLTALAVALIPASQGLADGTRLIPFKILAVNDLHGGLDTGRQVGGRAVGGAAYLAAYLDARAEGQPNAVVVGVGDMVGGSPPISGLLQDEPTVRAMNAMGFLLNTPGNHEFDEGVGEFFRLNQGGCHPTTGCFEGARFAQISANILNEATGEPLLAPYYVQMVRGVPVGFIGAAHSTVPETVVAGAVAGLSFPPPAGEINRYVGELQAQGVRAIVVLIHEGGFQDRQTRQLTGPITATLDALDPEVDVVVSSHTHTGYALRRGGLLVTQAFSSGTAFADISLQLDPRTGDVADASAEIVTTYNDEITPDPAVQAIVDQAEAQVAPQINRVVNVAAGPISRTVNDAGESAVGNLIADAFRWQTGAQVGLMNSGGMRADIPAGEVTWGQLFTVQPFGNDLVTLTVTGEQLYTLFNAQWVVQSDGTERYRPNQVSGLRVIWDASRPRGERIVSLALDTGEPIVRAADYTLAVNSFMAGGGEGYGVLRDARERQIRGVDLDALVAFVEQLPTPFSAAIEGRITRRG